MTGKETGNVATAQQFASLIVRSSEPAGPAPQSGAALGCGGAAGKLKREQYARLIGQKGSKFCGFATRNYAPEVTWVVPKSSFENGEETLPLLVVDFGHLFNFNG